jgi:uncharacterized phage protein (TIGR01671 family)
MRAIKFRAWNSRTKWMHDWLDLCCLPHTLKFFDEPKPYILMQYTGLKDKNGKEIYEGDIVKDKKGFGLIKWLPCNCAFGVLELTTFNKNKPIKEQEYYKLNCGEPRQLKETEVIGNIYSNPELLND